MLAALTVRDIVLIETAALEFAPGLNVLTGETGAGKSILLDALGLAAGGRAGARAGVRPGAGQGSATAVFEPPKGNAAFALLTEQSIPAESEIVLRRTLSQDGRTRAYVNDEPIGVALLRDIGGSLLEVHGQADDRGLFDVATHRGILDTFAAHDTLLRETATAFAAFDGARKALADLKAQVAAAEADAEYIRHAADELTTLDPEEGEEARLASEKALLSNATRIAEDVNAAAELLAGDKGAATSISGALKRLSRMNEDARRAAQSAEQALDQAYNAVEEARRELEVLQTRLDIEPGQLEKVEDRIHDLRSAARKYGVPTDGLVKLAADFRFKRDAIGGGGNQVKQAEAAVAAARTAFLTAAGKLSKSRAAAARKLEAAVAGELAPLKLGHAKFRVALETLGEDAATAHGLERVALEVATVEGAAFGSLTKIASGGELARFSLALKVALAERTPPAALVFDEVDRGVGGAVADAVGERLQRLAQTTQVLLVTHSPQVAARAERHFRISRIGDKTKVALLDDDARLEEVARMLSGAAVTAEARAAARRLIDEARAPAKKRKRA
ncbi:MAG: DNA repair protein RecN [Alphaproteobacteria bacterium]|nr:DNA repair protein RecN [Alphaproteobacteria bacterium]MBV9419636.1 DNA repair protein RecN [Alphaproteobacteria bacterium]